MISGMLQGGTTTQDHDVTLGKVTASVVVVGFSDSPFSVPSSISSVAASCLDGDVTIIIPSAEGNEGRLLFVSADHMCSSDNRVTIDVTGDGKINGISTYDLVTAMSSVILMVQNGQWRIF